MKQSTSWLRIVATALILLATMLPSKNAAAQDYYSDGASYQQFYDELSPYGQWIQDPQYGYVWAPNEGRDFRPYYTNGYWVNTEYGNTWVSNYDWGWAPFHYGRWTYDDYYGWLWIPGNEWGPAWVNWRNGGGYYGWAPLGPGVSISVSFGGWSAPSSWWVFTPQQYVLSPNFYEYCRPPQYNTTIINNTTVINNTYVNNHNTYIAGPRRRDLESATGRSILPYRINEVRTPRGTQVRGNEIAIFRPTINRTGDARPQRIATSRSPISSTPREVSPVRGNNMPPARNNTGFGGRTESTTRPVQAPVREPNVSFPQRNETRTPVMQAQPPRNVPQQQQPVRVPQQQPQRSWSEPVRNTARPPMQPQQQQPVQQMPRPARPAFQQQAPPQQPMRQPRMQEQSRPVAQPQIPARQAAPARATEAPREMRR